MLRRIHGPVQEWDIWRIRNNEELNKSIKGENIVKFIKAQKIKWLGHVKRTEEGAMLKKMMEGRQFRTKDLVFQFANQKLKDQDIWNYNLPVVLYGCEI
jgi:hypothetical protein